MFLTLMKGKIHRATVTQAHLNYVGSITVDETLMQLAGILPNEQVQVVNVNTGARLITYAIPGPAGSGVIGLNGAAARLVQVGDVVIIIAYALLTPEEAKMFRPRVVFVDAHNRPTATTLGEAAEMRDNA
ncbi:MAG: aspartate 1-decarboxylase [Hydrogenibacillus sp.]|nr:aspartate 1-decarboxylase [Hydrogenibacillus sp.]